MIETYAWRDSGGGKKTQQNPQSEQRVDKLRLEAGACRIRSRNANRDVQ